MHVPTPTLPIGLRLLRNYSGRHLPQDVLAGLLVAALAVPQSLGYAVVAGVPVQVGLYTLPPALLAYALFGSSRLLFVGPVSTVSVLSGSIVGALSGGNQELAITLTAILALTAGAVLVAVGLLRLGWVAQFLSEPIVTGFVAGLVVLIVIGEIPALAGVSAPSGGIFQRIDETVRNLGDFHGITLAVGAGALAVLFVGSRLLPRAPWSLIVLVGGIAVSTTADLAARGVRVVGEVPTGLPLPSIPVVDVQLWSGIITGGIAIAAVGIAEGLAAVRTFAPTGAIDPESDNREFVGHGAANLASGIFGGMGVGGSLSKTAANARAGAFTQVSGVAAALIVLLFVAFAAGLLADLPRAVLSAIVIHAVWGLVSPSTFRRYAAVRRNDFVAAVVAFGGVLFLGPLNGLLLAIAQSLLGLVYRSMQVGIDEMGRVEGEKAAWGSVANDSSRRTYRGVTVLRPDGPLFWANATSVVGHIEMATRARQPLYAVVLDLEATNQMDTTTAERLDGLLTRLRAEGTDLYLVRVFGNVRDVLSKSGFLETLGPDHVWHSIAAGVKAARAARAAGVDPANPFPTEDEVEALDEPDELDEGAGERIASKGERS
ncbi:sulfate permease [Ornithinibacter aureus]|uniref:Sulfate permease n=1 Tax=Ornithinibacter aureus TaxID=622664 RepID=A0ABP8K2Q7_9MICO|nr:SulP family inorganic anion transporter [Ornithinibacter aureus]KAF0833145.1 SulP family sulfate permease [Ornithinibacter aureus]